MLSDGSKHTAHIDGGPRTYMCEAATELDTGDMEYAGLSHTPTLSMRSG